MTTLQIVGGVLAYAAVLGWVICLCIVSKRADEMERS